MLLTIVNLCSSGHTLSLGNTDHNYACTNPMFAAITLLYISTAEDSYTWGSKVLHRLLNFIMADMCKQKIVHKPSHVVSAICPLLGLETSIGQNLS